MKPVKTGKTSAKVDEEFFSPVDFAASLSADQLRERVRAERSLYDFVNVVMGYGALTKTCNYRLHEPIHRPMCERAQAVIPIYGRENRETQVKLLDLEPRGSLKTNVISVGSILYYLAHNYNGRVLLSSHLHKAAKEILQLVMWHIEFNPKFKELYGDWAYYARRYGKWAADSVQLAFRDVGLREPTIDTAGAEISKTGGHYDLIVVDDIQSRENVKSDLQRQNVRERFQEYNPQLEPYGGMLVVATRYHRADVYGWIMRKKEESLKRGIEPEWLFDIYTHGAWNPDGSLYYPTRLTRPFLEQQRNELEEYLFSCWYLNEPIEEASKVFINPRRYERSFDFVREIMPYIELPSGERRSLFITAAWDPAGRESTNKRTDFHGITIVGTDGFGIWWTLAALELKAAPDELLTNIANQIDYYRVRRLSIEVRGAGMQGLWIDLLRPVLKERMIEVEIVEYSPGNAESKEARIRGLQPRHRRGHWWHRKGFCDPLLDQMDDFPQCDHDDVLDSAVQHTTVSRAAAVDDVDTSQAEADFDREEGKEPLVVEGGAWVGLGTPDYYAAAS